MRFVRAAPLSCGAARGAAHFPPRRSDRRPLISVVCWSSCSSCRIPLESGNGRRARIGLLDFLAQRLPDLLIEIEETRMKPDFLHFAARARQIDVEYGFDGGRPGRH